MVHFWKPWNMLSGHHLIVGTSSVCSQGMPCQALWSGMLEMGRDGQRRLRFSKTRGYILSCVCQSAGAISGHVIVMFTLLLRKTALQSMHPAQSLGSSKIPCQKGVKNRTFTPDPRTFTKMSQILLQTPLVS